MFGGILALALTASATIASATNIVGRDRSAGAFSYDNTTFYYDGEPFRILGGQIDPPRVPREYWHDRVHWAKAMGLNTIFSYVYWNDFEPSPGVWDWQGIRGNNDLAAWYQIIKDAEMKAVLRTGPCVCGERDWGGFPAWLGQVPNNFSVTVRTTNPQFLTLTDYYLGDLSQQIDQYQTTKGGPILMAHVENEYGNFASDHAYTSELSALITKHFDVLQYTNDAGIQANLEGGQIHGVLAEVDGNPYWGFGNLTKYTVDPTSKGPLLDGEYYVKQLVTWGPNALYPKLSGIQFNDTQIIQGLNWILGQGGSFSLYMFHGGTNFAFGAGSLSFGQLMAVTASYDYGAPLNESGRPSEIYYKLQAAITDFNGKIPPAPPATPDMYATGDIPMTPVALLFDDLPPLTLSGWPINMEELGQSYGYILYRFQAPSYGSAAERANVTGLLQPGDGPRDRVIAYINGTKKGVIDAMYLTDSRQNVTLSVMPGDTLDILVENQGRIDYYSPILDQRKGIVGDVYIGDQILAPWEMYSYPVPQPPMSVTNRSASYSSTSGISISTNSTPVWYTGSFEIPADKCGTAAADTYIEIQGGVHGVLFVNGYNLGKYWKIGPQQSQYVPGAWLKEENEIVILELEPQAGVQVIARGLATRSWYNNEDPDCLGCLAANPNAP